MERGDWVEVDSIAEKEWEVEVEVEVDWWVVLFAVVDIEEEEEKEAAGESGDEIEGGLLSAAGKCSFDGDGFACVSTSLANTSCSCMRMR